MSGSAAQVSRELNGDLSCRVVVDTAAMEWQASPGGEVLRKRLHLVGSAEGGQVTSLVRFPPGSSFPMHDHPDGEEILVLEGTFSDEGGSWGRGGYLLNPDGSPHSPYSEEGCLLFVKLQQYGGEGRPTVRLDTARSSWCPTSREGVAEKVLFRDARFPDETRLERWGEGSGPCDASWPEGAEIFILRGELEDEEGSYAEGSWLRLPPGSRQALRSAQGCEIYVKQGGVAGLRRSQGAGAE